MTNPLPGRPEPDEYPSYSQTYIDCVKGGDILVTLSEQLDALSKLLARVDDHVAGTFVYVPGKWTIKQVIGHIIDSERIFAYRALRFARNDSTPLPGFDENIFASFAASNERTLDSLLEEFRLVRQGTIALFRGIPSDAWLRRGVANNNSVTVRGVAFQMGGHEAHHSKILRERYLPGVKA